MADPRLFRLRVTFRETGRLAMLSHLELARALERAVRRAQLPFAVSQGFSPHMRIAFGAALPVGVGGTAEIFDLFLTDYVPALRALAALQEASPADLYPTEARYIEARDAAASVALPVSTYEVVLSEAPGAIVVPEAITVVRKKKEKTLVPADFLVGPVSLDGATVRFSLEAKPTGSLRADRSPSSASTSAPPRGFSPAKWLGNHESSAERAKIGLPCNTEPDVSPAGVLQKGFQELGMPDLSSFPSHFRQRRGEKRRDCRSFVVFKPTRANEGMI